MDDLEIIGDFDAGLFAAKVAEAMKDAGEQAIQTGKVAQVTIDLKYKPINGSMQCEVNHKLTSTIPHMHGKTRDEDEKATIVYIHSNGQQAITPQDQRKLFEQEDA